MSLGKSDVFRFEYLRLLSLRALLNTCSMQRFGILTTWLPRGCYMTESLWLEKPKDNGAQLLLVKQRSNQVLLQQNERLHVLADPWRGRFVCVSTALNKQSCIATLSADGDVEELAELPEGLKWQPCSFSFDGKQLLLAGYEQNRNLCALAVCRVDDFNSERFSVGGILRASANEGFYAPQFSNARIGVFVSRADSTQLFFHEWSLENQDNTELVRLGFPGKAEPYQLRIVLIFERPFMKKQLSRVCTTHKNANPCVRELRRVKTFVGARTQDPTHRETLAIKVIHAANSQGAQIAILLVASK